MCHDPAALIMQPSHLCPSCFSKARNLLPFRVCRKDDGQTCDVKTAVFVVFNWNPTFFLICVPGSNTPIVCAAVRANKGIPSAKRRPSKNAVLSPRSEPHFRGSAFGPSSRFPLQYTAQHTWAQHTHPCRIPVGWEKDRCCYVHYAFLERNATGHGTGDPRACFIYAKYHAIVLSNLCPVEAHNATNKFSKLNAILPQMFVCMMVGVPGEFSKVLPPNLPHQRPYLVNFHPPHRTMKFMQ